MEKQEHLKGPHFKLKVPCERMGLGAGIPSALWVGLLHGNCMYTLFVQGWSNKVLFSAPPSNPGRGREHGLCDGGTYVDPAVPRWNNLAVACPLLLLFKESEWMRYQISDPTISLDMRVIDI